MSPDPAAPARIPGMGTNLVPGIGLYSAEVDEYCGYPFITRVMDSGLGHVRRHAWNMKVNEVNTKLLDQHPMRVVKSSLTCNVPRFSSKNNKNEEWFYVEHRCKENFVTPIFLHVGGSQVWAIIATHYGEEKLVQEVIDYLYKIYPLDQQIDPDTIPVAFWALGNEGPYSTTRSIDAPNYSAINTNYSSKTHGFLDSLVSYQPKKGGEMILLSGDPGTGKTYALRALFRSWKEWADFHYIVDPLTLFGGSPDYLMKVIMGAANNRPTPWGGDDDDDDEKSASKWRVILMEDCGELLSTNAKHDVGQGLGQLLNVTDGMLGQGLKLVLVMTTNEKLGDLHHAISRPGRCALHHEFEKLSSEEAKAWLEAHKVGDKFDGKAHTIAELYAMMLGEANQGQVMTAGAKANPVGFTV